MIITGIGNTGLDYEKTISRQVDQTQAQPESNTALVQQVQTVQQADQSSAAYEQGSAEQELSATAAAAQQLSQSLASSDETSTNTTLINKANSGAELTQSELSELKDLDIALYSQAVRAQEARAEVRAQMKAEPSAAASTASEAIAQALREENSDLAVKAIRDESNAYMARYDQGDFGAQVWR